MIGDILKAHAVAPEDAVMIGDREFDMIGAKALGVTAIGALWGSGTREELPRRAPTRSPRRRWRRRSWRSPRLGLEPRVGSDPGTVK